MSTYSTPNHLQSSGRISTPDSVTNTPYFLKFSIINRRLEKTSTSPIRFLNPRNEGAASDSWLRHDVRLSLCTAKVCLYFFGVLLSIFLFSRQSAFGGLPLMETLSGACPFAREGGISVAVLVAAMSAVKCEEWLFERGSCRLLYG